MLGQAFGLTLSSRRAYGGISCAELYSLDDPAAPVWDPDNLLNHFEEHSREPGHTTIADYEACSRTTIGQGERFSYPHRAPGGRVVSRVGYYNRSNRHLTVLNEDESEFVSHFVAREAYVDGLRARGAGTQENQT